MSQEEVMELLQKHKKGLTIRQMAKILDKAVSCITHNCLNLRQQGEIRAVNGTRPYVYVLK